MLRRPAQRCRKLIRNANQRANASTSSAAPSNENSAPAAHLHPSPSHSVERGRSDRVVSQNPVDECLHPTRILLPPIRILTNQRGDPRNKPRTSVRVQWDMTVFCARAHCVAHGPPFLRIAGGDEPRCGHDFSVSARQPIQMPVREFASTPPPSHRPGHLNARQCANHFAMIRLRAPEIA